MIDEDATIKVGDITQLMAIVRPTNATEKHVNWSVSDSSILSVDSRGTVKALAPGTAKVYATSVSDSSIKAECDITVIANDSGDSDDKNNTETGTIKFEEGTDENRNPIIYIRDTSGKEIDKVLVDGIEITKDKNGNYYFSSTENGERSIIITYKDGTIEEATYTESSYSNGNSSDSSKGETTGNQNSATSSDGVSSKTSNKSVDKTKTGLSSLPYAGIKGKIVIFIVIVGIISVIVWFKSRDIKY